MSCSAHKAEIDKDALQRLLDARVLSFSGLRCPFCGDADLFVHAPGTGHWSGRRTWWTIGCDSRKCNSCWTLNDDTYERAMMKIRHAQNGNNAGAEPAKPDPCSGWVGKLTHDRSKHADWGWLRDESGELIVIVKIPFMEDEELHEHRRNGTDPAQARVDAVLAAINRQNVPAVAPVMLDSASPDDVMAG